MDSSTAGKRSLYRAASTSHRPTLPQGKLQSSAHSRAKGKGHHSSSPPSSPPSYSALHSHIDRKSERRQTRAGGIDPASSPRRPPPPPSSRFPSTEHTITFSLSSSSSDRDVTPHHLTESHPPIHIVPSPGAQPSSESHPVLVVDAQTAIPTHSGAVPVITTEVPSMVKVVRHSPGDGDFSTPVPSEPLPISQDMDWRRFTNSFVTLPTPVGKTTASGEANKPNKGGGGGGMEDVLTTPVVLKTAGTEFKVPSIDSVANKNKKPQKGRIVPSRYMAAASSSNRRPPAPQPTRSARTVLTSTPITPRFGGHAHPHHQDGSYLSGLSPSVSTSKRTAKNVSRASESRVSRAGASQSRMSSTGASQSRMSSTGASQSRVSSAGASQSRVSRAGQSADMELDLWYSRLIQAAYLDVMSAKALRKQEEAAKSQLHRLWCAVEDQRRENAQVEREIERLEREQALKKSLDTQLHGLDPACGYLQEVGQNYGSMARALDTTRHELTVSGVAPVSEDQLLEELSQCEAMLGDTLAMIRDKIPTVSEFADSTEAVAKTLDREFQEMNSCWEGLATATRSQLHATSLLFEERQRARDSSNTTL